MKSGKQIKTVAALAGLLLLAGCGGGGGGTTAQGMPGGQDPGPGQVAMPTTDGSVADFDGGDTQEAMDSAATNDPVAGSVNQSSLGTEADDRVAVQWDGEDYVSVAAAGSGGAVWLDSTNNLKFVRDEAKVPDRVPAYGTHLESVETYELIRNDHVNHNLSIATVNVLWDPDNTDSYFVAGYWLRGTALNDNANRDIDVGAFIDGPEFEARDPATNPLASTNESASFTGKFAGLTSQGGANSLVVGYASGTVELDATLHLSAISGTITFDHQSTDSGLRQHKLNLAVAYWTNTGWIQPAGVKIAPPGLGSPIGTGKWGGYFSVHDDSTTGHPRGVAGTAGVSWDGTGQGGWTGVDGSIIGFFVADLD